MINSYDSASFGYRDTSEVERECRNIPAKKFSVRASSTKNPLTYPSQWIRHREYDISLYGVYERRDRDYIISTSFLSDEERGEFLRFYDFLVMYNDFVPKKKELHPTDYYWRQTLMYGYSFTDYVKDLYAYSYRNSFGSGFIPPDEFKGITIEGYNDVPPYQGFMKYIEDVNDIEWSFISVSGCDGEDSFILYEKLVSMFREIPSIEFISELEILMETSISSSFDPKINKSVPSYKARDMTFSRELRGRRAVVNVYPGGCRDTVVLKKSSSNTVRLLERQMRHLLEYIPESAVSLKSSTYERKMNRFFSASSNNSFHYLRDIKKCGLTFPLGTMIDVFIEAANTVYPNHFWEYFRAYQNLSVCGLKGPDDFEYHQPERGYFLGMANHLVTFLLIALNRIAIDRFYEEYDDLEEDIYFRSLIGNDDCDVRIIDGSRSLSDISLAAIARDFSRVHDLTLGAFSVMVNERKSFISKYPLFFERYSQSEFKYKESRYAVIMASALAHTDIRSAKQLVRSFMSSINDINYKVLVPMIDYVSNKFGFEFFPEEINYDYALGGWFRHVERGLNQATLEIFDLSEIIDTRMIERIVRTVEKYDNFSAFPESKINDFTDNATRLGITLELTGTAPSKLNGAVCNRRDQERFYNKILAYYRNPQQFVDRCKQIRKSMRSAELPFGGDLMKLVCYLHEKTPSAIHDKIVKKCNAGQQCVVNRSWLSNEDLPQANKTLKKVLGCLDSTLESPYEFDIRDSWELIDKFEGINEEGYSRYAIISPGPIQSICVDGISSLYEYYERTGDCPTELFIEPKNEILPWRQDPLFLKNEIQSLEEIEDSELGPAELKIFGICKQEPKEEDPDIEPEPPDSDNDSEENYFPYESEYEEQESEEEEELFYTAADVNDAFYRKLLTEKPDRPLKLELCELHSAAPFNKQVYSIVSCMICQLRLRDDSIRSGFEEEFNIRTYSFEQIIINLGFEKEEDIDFEEGGFDMFM